MKNFRDKTAHYRSKAGFNSLLSPLNRHLTETNRKTAQQKHFVREGYKQPLLFNVRTGNLFPSRYIFLSGIKLFYQRGGINGWKILLIVEICGRNDFFWKKDLQEKEKSRTFAVQFLNELCPNVSIKIFKQDLSKGRQF